MPKPDGRPRSLGMPPGRDRVVQAAGPLVVEAVCEASVRDSSEGFRPTRDAGPAVRAVQAALVGGGWVLAADMPDGCETIDHGRRLRLVPRRVSDRRGLKRLRPWRTVGGVEDGRGQATPTGPPPGERGRADASLYRRFHEAGLDYVHMLPQLATYWDRSHMHAVEDRLTAVLSLTEA
jgi:RNA-directed DNA polymerase